MRAAAGLSTPKGAQSLNFSKNVSSSAKVFSSSHTPGTSTNSINDYANEPYWKEEYRENFLKKSELGYSGLGYSEYFLNGIF